MHKLHRPHLAQKHSDHTLPTTTTTTTQVKSPQQRAAAAAAAAKASAAEATAAARTLASHAAQQAEAADRAAAADAPTSPSAALLAADSVIEDENIFPDLPSISELKSVASAWFGDSDAAESSTAAAAAGEKAGQDAAAAAAVAAGGEEDSEEGLLEKLLPSFGKDSGLRKRTAELVPTFRAGRHKSKPKPLRLKLAEQVCAARWSVSHLHVAGVTHRFGFEFVLCAATDAAAQAHSVSHRDWPEWK